jgi:4-hydroxybenzoate polyprenyltransferase
LIPSQFAPAPSAVKDLKLLFALSRTPHGLIDMATPALAALLCIGHFPDFPVVIIGLITVFAGYTSVYALNDLIDYQTDKQKVCIGGYCDGEDYLDGALIRHPMAKGALSFSTGLVWTVCWALIALAGAWWLNPVCLYIFLTGCVLEGLYCLLLRVTPLRAALNGVVKSIGAIAAVYAVNPKPSILFLMALFLWIFSWEIGGQNIPNDWTDIQEDRQFKARTIPVVLGLRRASLISLTALTCTLFLNFILFWAAPLNFSPLLLVAALAANAWLLLWPALQLAEKQERQAAMTLFNRASYYPLTTLILVLTGILS